MGPRGGKITPIGPLMTKLHPYPSLFRHSSLTLQTLREADIMSSRQNGVAHRDEDGAFKARSEAQLNFC